MKFTLSWLRKFLDTKATLDEISITLTDLGFEVEEIIDKSSELKDFTVAHIKSTFPHPNADKLKICEVETAQGMLQIVCGAANARADLKVIFAKIGSIIPNERFKIKESEIRGIKSHGMLCSEKELNVGKNSEGIIELPQDAIIGEGIAKYYGLDDPVIEINVTPNRGDALGVYGIARELAAKGVGKLKNIENCTLNLQIHPANIESHSANLQSHPANLQSHSINLQSHLANLQSHSINLQSHLANLQSHPELVSGSKINQCTPQTNETLKQVHGYNKKGDDKLLIFHSKFDIKIENFANCPLFAVREIKNIRNKPSPSWLQNLLRNIGLNSISAIVDITNYIAYSFGQPMHAYDRSKIGDYLKVQSLNKEQQFQALNNVVYNLSQGDLVITDATNIQCLAGIIGSGTSSCDEHTSHIILEAARFNPIQIIKTGQKLQINTDSRTRFERGVDSEFTLYALDIATSMILEICDGSDNQIMISNVISRGTIQNPTHLTIELSLNNIERHIGLKLEDKVIKDILYKLGFKIQELTSNILQVTPPSWRHDIKIKEDIIEEIIRLYGYENIPKIKLDAAPNARIIPTYYRQNETIKRTLASAGYDEVVTWSFMKDTDASNFGQINEELLILNPISADLNYMRSSVIPNLLKLANKNWARSIKDIAIFEGGPTFHGITPDDEKFMISGIRCGMNSSRSWHNNRKPYDVYDIKADLEVIFKNINFDFDKLQIDSVNPVTYYHPNRFARLSLGKNIIAYFGQIHPKIQKTFDIDSEIYAFELYGNNIPIGKNKYGLKTELVCSDFQSSQRDFSFIIDESLPIGDIIKFIYNIDKNFIRKVELFDIYIQNTGEVSKKSIALSVVIQASNRTMTEIELNELSNLIINKVELKFGAKLRMN